VNKGEIDRETGRREREIGGYLGGSERGIWVR
jgi:hypothetical protein